MKAKHVFGGHMYVISNFGVARNPIFMDQQDLKFFKEKFEEYLSPICEVHVSNHQINQFQYMIQIKERSVLEFFYIEKMKSKKKNISNDLYEPNGVEIPESYLIFSQEVSNFLNSVAKKFNFRHGRKGSLFGDRYQKILVESEEDMRMWSDRLENMEALVEFEGEWEAKELNDEELHCLESSSVIRKGRSNDYLRGCFEILPPLSFKSSLFSSKFEKYFKFHRKKPPW